jgi:hypothetical protein
MEEDERESQESQFEPDKQPGPGDEASQAQPEPEMEPQSAPTSSTGQPPSTSKERRWQFLLGLGIGFIPLVLFFIGFVPNAFALITISLILLVVALIASIICIAIPRVRYIGYGLLTSIPISLVVGSIGCIIIISRPPGG